MHTDTHRQTHTDRHTQTHTDTDTPTQTHTGTNRHPPTHTHAHTHTGQRWLKRAMEYNTLDEHASGYVKCGVSLLHMLVAISAQVAAAKLLAPPPAFSILTPPPT